jgi:SAM-dependent methyltransferase
VSEPDGQSTRAAQANVDYFEQQAGAYATWLETIDSYKLQAAAVTRELRGLGRVADVGNSGAAFDYDPSVVDEIVAIDLAAAPGALPPNARFVRGSALDLPLEDHSVDAVVMVMLLHHLVGDAPDQMRANTKIALREARRVLTPGGTLVLCESCVPDWFHTIEPLLYRPLGWFASTRGHPPTFQLSARIIRELVASEFSVEKVERVPFGRWTVQLGRRWPTFATPARPWIVRARSAP